MQAQFNLESKIQIQKKKLWKIIDNLNSNNIFQRHINETRDRTCGCPEKLDEWINWAVISNGGWVGALS